MNIRSTFGLLLLVTPLLTLAGAPTPTSDEKQTLRTYCMADIQRLCPQVEPGGGRIKACLMAHKEAMSVGCAQALQKMRPAKP